MNLTRGCRISNCSQQLKTLLSPSSFAPHQVNVTLEKEVAGFWVHVPCVEELGSCHYQDACDILNQLIPPGQDCPEPLHTYGLPCHCPFKAVSPFSDKGMSVINCVSSRNTVFNIYARDTFYCRLLIENVRLLIEHFRKY